MNRFCDFWLLCVSALAALALDAGDCTWTGLGETTAWSDADNWSKAPEEGDKAIFASGIVPVAGTDKATFDLFSAFEIKKGAILSITGLNATLKQTLTGGGTLRATDNNDANNVLTITANNSAFTGTFAFTNQSVWLNAKYGLGTTNAVYMATTAAPSVSLRRSIEMRGSAPSILSNVFYFAGNSSKAPVIFNHYLSGGVTLAGPVHLVANNIALRDGGSSAYWIAITGGIDGSGTLVASGSGNTLRIRGEPIRLTTPAGAVSSTSPSYSNVGGNLYADNDSFLIGTTIESGYLSADPAGFKFSGANLSTKNAHWGFALGQHNPGTYDLNGFDQHCGNMCYLMSLPTATLSSMVITSTQKATLTMHGLMQHVYQSASDPVDKRRRFAGLLNGAVTFVLDSDLQSTPGSIRFLGAGSTTTGGLISKKGTVEVLADATFPNLTELSAVNVGKLTVSTAAIGTSGTGLTVKASDSGVLTIDEDLILNAKVAFLAGKWVEPGDYGGSAAGLDAAHTCANLAGKGILRVAKYGGKRGVVLYFK